MDVSRNIGECAGRIYFFLKEHDECTDLADILRNVNPDASLVLASMGWLLREDKIEASIEDNVLFLCLKD